MTAVGRFKVTVYASSSDRIDPAYAGIAEELGQSIAERGFAEGFIQPHFRGLWTVAADAAEAIEQIATAAPWHVRPRDPRGGGSA